MQKLVLCVSLDKKNAAARESLGLPATYGAPIMMPPTNRLGGALQIASTVASIYSGFGGASIFSSFGAKAASSAASSSLASSFTGGGLGLMGGVSYSPLVNTAGLFG